MKWHYLINSIKKIKCKRYLIKGDQCEVSWGDWDMEIKELKEEILKRYGRYLFGIVDIDVWYDRV